MKIAADAARRDGASESEASNERRAASSARTGAKPAAASDEAERPSTRSAVATVAETTRAEHPPSCAPAAACVAAATAARSSEPSSSTKEGLERSAWSPPASDAASDKVLSTPPALAVVPTPVSVKGPSFQYGKSDDACQRLDEVLPSSILESAWRVATYPCSAVIRQRGPGVLRATPRTNPSARTVGTAAARRPSTSNHTSAAWKQALGRCGRILPPSTRVNPCRLTVTFHRSDKPLS